MSWPFRCQSLARRKHPPRTLCEQGSPGVGSLGGLCCLAGGEDGWRGGALEGGVPDTARPWHPAAGDPRPHTFHPVQVSARMHAHTPIHLHTHTHTHIRYTAHTEAAFTPTPTLTKAGR